MITTARYGMVRGASEFGITITWQDGQSRGGFDLTLPEARRLMEQITTAGKHAARLERDDADKGKRAAG